MIIRSQQTSRSICTTPHHWDRNCHRPLSEFELPPRIEQACSAVSRAPAAEHGQGGHGVDVGAGVAVGDGDGVPVGVGFPHTVNCAGVGVCIGVGDGDGGGVGDGHLKLPRGPLAAGGPAERTKLLAKGSFPGHWTGFGFACSLSELNQLSGALTTSTTLGSKLGGRPGWPGHSGGFFSGHGTAILTLNIYVWSAASFRVIVQGLAEEI